MKKTRGLVGILFLGRFRLKTDSHQITVTVQHTLTTTTQFAVYILSTVCLLLFYLQIDIGRSTESGSGTITFKSADKEISYSIRETIYAAQNSAMQNSNHNPSRRDRKKPNSSSSSSSGFNNIRNRTNSWSNPRPMSANRLTAGTIGTGTGSTHHQRQHSDAIVNSVTENSASAIPTVDKRFRTTSEGNAHFDIKPRSICKSSYDFFFP